MTTHARKALIVSLLMTGAMLLSFTPTATAHGGNHGTIKVHDNETADPDRRNEPHVTCDFYIEGFNMHDSNGSLEFRIWPPSGNMTVVIPAGDDLNWSGTPEPKDGYHFVNGPYFLPDGHYRIEAFSNNGTPSGHDHFSKTKTFWVDPCEDGEIPVFPSVLAGMAAVAVGAVAYLGLRRR